MEVEQRQTLKEHTSVDNGKTATHHPKAPEEKSTTNVRHATTTTNTRAPLSGARSTGNLSGTPGTPRRVKSMDILKRTAILPNNEKTIANRHGSEYVHSSYRTSGSRSEGLEKKGAAAPSSRQSLHFLKQIEEKEAQLGKPSSSTTSTPTTATGKSQTSVDRISQSKTASNSFLKNIQEKESKLNEEERRSDGKIKEGTESVVGTLSSSSSAAVEASRPPIPPKRTYTPVPPKRTKAPIPTQRPAVSEIKTDKVVVVEPTSTPDHDVQAVATKVTANPVATPRPTFQRQLSYENRKMLKDAEKNFVYLPKQDAAEKNVATESDGTSGATVEHPDHSVSTTKPAGSKNDGRHAPASSTPSQTRRPAFQHQLSFENRKLVKDAEKSFVYTPKRKDGEEQNHAEDGASYQHDSPQAEAEVADQKVSTESHPPKNDGQAEAKSTTASAPSSSRRPAFQHQLSYDERKLVKDTEKGFVYLPNGKEQKHAKEDESQPATAEKLDQKVETESHIPESEVETTAKSSTASASSSSSRRPAFQHQLSYDERKLVKDTEKGFVYLPKGKERKHAKEDESHLQRTPLATAEKPDQKVTTESHTPESEVETTAKSSTASASSSSSRRPAFQQQVSFVDKKLVKDAEKTFVHLRKPEGPENAADDEVSRRDKHRSRAEPEVSEVDSEDVDAPIPQARIGHAERQLLKNSETEVPSRDLERDDISRDRPVATPRERVAYAEKKLLGDVEAEGDVRSSDAADHHHRRTAPIPQEKIEYHEPRRLQGSVAAENPSGASLRSPTPSRGVAYVERKLLANNDEAESANRAPSSDDVVARAVHPQNKLEYAERKLLEGSGTGPLRRVAYAERRLLGDAAHDGETAETDAHNPIPAPRDRVGYVERKLLGAREGNVAASSHARVGFVERKYLKDHDDDDLDAEHRHVDARHTAPPRPVEYLERRLLRNSELAHPRAAQQTLGNVERNLLTGPPVNTQPRVGYVERKLLAEPLADENEKYLSYLSTPDLADAENDRDEAQRRVGFVGRKLIAAPASEEVEDVERYLRYLSNPDLNAEESADPQEVKLAETSQGRIGYAYRKLIEVAESDRSESFVGKSSDTGMSENDEFDSDAHSISRNKEAEDKELSEATNLNVDDSSEAEAAMSSQFARMIEEAEAESSRQAAKHSNADAAAKEGEPQDSKELADETLSRPQNSASSSLKPRKSSLLLKDAADNKPDSASRRQRSKRVSFEVETDEEKDSTANPKIVYQMPYKTSTALVARIPNRYLRRKSDSQADAELGSSSSLRRGSDSDARSSTESMGRMKDSVSIEFTVGIFEATSQDLIDNEDFAAQQIGIRNLIRYKSDELLTRIQTAERVADIESGLREAEVEDARAPLKRATKPATVEDATEEDVAHPDSVNLKVALSADSESRDESKALLQYKSNQFLRRIQESEMNAISASNAEDDERSESDEASNGESPALVKYLSDQFLRRIREQEEAADAAAAEVRRGKTALVALKSERKSAETKVAKAAAKPNSFVLHFRHKPENEILKLRRAEDDLVLRTIVDFEKRRILALSKSNGELRVAKAEAKYLRNVRDELLQTPNGEQKLQVVRRTSNLLLSKAREQAAADIGSLDDRKKQESESSLSAPERKSAEEQEKLVEALKRQHADETLKQLHAQQENEDFERELALNRDAFDSLQPSEKKEIESRAFEEAVIRARFEKEAAATEDPTTVVAPPAESKADEAEPVQLTAPVVSEQQQDDDMTLAQRVEITAKRARRKEKKAAKNQQFQAKKSVQQSIIEAKLAELEAKIAQLLELQHQQTERAEVQQLQRQNNLAAVNALISSSKNDISDSPEQKLASLAQRAVSIAALQSSSAESPDTPAQQVSLELRRAESKVALEALERYEEDQSDETANNLATALRKTESKAALDALLEFQKDESQETQRTVQEVLRRFKSTASFDAIRDFEVKAAEIAVERATEVLRRAQVENNTLPRALDSGHAETMAAFTFDDKSIEEALRVLQEKEKEISEGAASRVTGFLQRAESFAILARLQDSEQQETRAAAAVALEYLRRSEEMAFARLSQDATETSANDSNDQEQPADQPRAHVVENQESPQVRDLLAKAESSAAQNLLRFAEQNELRLKLDSTEASEKSENQTGDADAEQDSSFAEEIATLEIETLRHAESRAALSAVLLLEQVATHDAAAQSFQNLKRAESRAAFLAVLEFERNATEETAARAIEALRRAETAALQKLLKDVQDEEGERASEVIPTSSESSESIAAVQSSNEADKEEAKQSLEASEKLKRAESASAFKALVEFEEEEREKAYQARLVAIQEAERIAALEDVEREQRHEAERKEAFDLQRAESRAALDAVQVFDAETQKGSVLKQLNAWHRAQSLDALAALQTFDASTQQKLVLKEFKQWSKTQDLEALAALQAFNAETQRKLVVDELNKWNRVKLESAQISDTETQKKTVLGQLNSWHRAQSLEALAALQMFDATTQQKFVMKELKLWVENQNFEALAALQSFNAEAQQKMVIEELNKWNLAAKNAAQISSAETEKKKVLDQLNAWHRAQSFQALAALQTFDAATQQKIVLRELKQWNENQNLDALAALQSFNAEAQQKLVIDELNEWNKVTLDAARVSSAKTQKGKVLEQLNAWHRAQSIEALSALQAFDAATQQKIVLKELKQWTEDQNLEALAALQSFNAEAQQKLVIDELNKWNKASFEAVQLSESETQKKKVLDQLNAWHRAQSVEALAALQTFDATTQQKIVLEELKQWSEIQNKEALAALQSFDAEMQKKLVIQELVKWNRARDEEAAAAVQSFDAETNKVIVLRELQAWNRAQSVEAMAALQTFNAEAQQKIVLRELNTWNRAQSLEALAALQTFDAESQRKIVLTELNSWNRARSIEALAALQAFDTETQQKMANATDKTTREGSEEITDDALRRAESRAAFQALQDFEDAERQRAVHLAQENLKRAESQAALRALEEFEVEENEKNLSKARESLERAESRAAFAALQSFNEEEEQLRVKRSAEALRRAESRAAFEALLEFENEENERRMLRAEDEMRRARSFAAIQALQEFEEEESFRRSARRRLIKSQSKAIVASLQELEQKGHFDARQELENVLNANQDEKSFSLLNAIEREENSKQQQNEAKLSEEAVTLETEEQDARLVETGAASYHELLSQAAATPLPQNGDDEVDRRDIELGSQQLVDEPDVKVSDPQTQISANTSGDQATNQQSESAKDKRDVLSLRGREAAEQEKSQDTTGSKSELKTAKPPAQERSTPGLSGRRASGKKVQAVRKTPSEVTLDSRKRSTTSIAAKSLPDLGSTPAGKTPKNDHHIHPMSFAKSIARSTKASIKHLVEAVEEKFKHSTEAPAQHPTDGSILRLESALDENAGDLDARGYGDRAESLDLNPPKFNEPRKVASFQFEVNGKESSISMDDNASDADYSFRLKPCDDVGDTVSNLELPLSDAGNSVSALTEFSDCDDDDYVMIGVDDVVKSEDFTRASLGSLFGPDLQKSEHKLHQDTSSLASLFGGRNENRAESQTIRNSQNSLQLPVPQSKRLLKPEGDDDRPRSAYSTNSSFDEAFKSDAKVPAVESKKNGSSKAPKKLRPKAADIKKGRSRADLSSEALDAGHVRKIKLAAVVLKEVPGGIGRTPPSRPSSPNESPSNKNSTKRKVQTAGEKTTAETRSKQDVVPVLPKLPNVAKDDNYLDANAANQNNTHDTEHNDLVYHLQAELKRLEAELVTRDAVLKSLHQKEEQLKGDDPAYASREAAHRAKRLALHAQKQAYQTVIGRLRQEVNWLRFQRNSPNDPVRHANLLPYLPKTHSATKDEQNHGPRHNLHTASHPSNSSEEETSDPLLPRTPTPLEPNKRPLTAKHGDGDGLFFQRPNTTSFAQPWLESMPTETNVTNDPDHLDPVEDRIWASPLITAPPIRKYHDKPPRAATAGAAAAARNPPPLIPSPESQSEVDIKLLQGVSGERRPLRKRDRVMVVVDGHRTLGVVKYVGNFDLQPNTHSWVGVALDEAVGKHDGIILGKRYFSCLLDHGYFCKIEKVALMQKDFRLPRVLTGHAHC